MRRMWAREQEAPRTEERGAAHGGMEHGWHDGAGRAAGVGEGRLRVVHAYMIQNTCSKVKRGVCPPLSTVVLVLHNFGKTRVEKRES